MHRCIHGDFGGCIDCNMRDWIRSERGPDGAIASLGDLLAAKDAENAALKAELASAYVAIAAAVERIKLAEAVKRADEPKEAKP